MKTLDHALSDRELEAVCQRCAVCGVCTFASLVSCSRTNYGAAKSVSGARTLTVVLGLEPSSLVAVGEPAARNGGSTCVLLRVV